MPRRCCSAAGASRLVVSRLVLSRRVASCRRPFYFLCPSISSPLPLILQSAKIAESPFLLKTSIIITDFFRHFCTFNTYSVNAQSFNFAAYSLLYIPFLIIHFHIRSPAGLHVQMYARQRYGLGKCNKIITTKYSSYSRQIHFIIT